MLGKHHAQRQHHSVFGMVYLWILLLPSLSRMKLSIEIYILFEQDFNAPRRFSKYHKTHVPYLNIIRMCIIGLN